MYTYLYPSPIFVFGSQRERLGNKTVFYQILGLAVFPDLGAWYEASLVGIGVVFATNSIPIHSQS